MPPGAHSTAVEFSCRQRRQLLDQGVRRHLRRRGQLHPLSGAPGHGAGLSRWPARDRLQHHGRHADLRHGPRQRRRHRRLGHRRRRCPLRHRRLLPGPARGWGDPAPARRLTPLHAARRSDRQPGLRRDCASRSGRSGRPEERRLDRHDHLRDRRVRGHLRHRGRGPRPSRRAIASRSSTRTRRMPRSPISRSPFSARGPDHGLGFRHSGHPAY